jgi:cytochrome c-type biogenesis protein CcmH/NrfG
MVPRAHRQSIKAKAETLREEARELFIQSSVDTESCETLCRALTKAKRALLLDPSDYDALTLIGSIYAEFDSPESAERASEYYDRALRIQPDNPEAYASKAGLLLYVLEKPDEAEPLAKTAVALSLRRQDPPEVLELQYITLVDVLIARRRFTEARAVIRRALLKCPTKLLVSTTEESLKQIADEEKKRDG